VTRAPKRGPRASTRPPEAPKVFTGHYLARKLAAHGQALAATLPRVDSASDDEAIHDMRVAIRRLRTLLKLARPVYGSFYADSVRRAFTEAQKATGALRDEEVLHETLMAIAERDPTFDAWRKRRTSRARVLRVSAVRKLRGDGDVNRARKLLEALVSLPVNPKREIELEKFVRRSLERATKEVARRSDVSPDDSVALHSLRIAYKHLRYSIEAFDEVSTLIDATALERAVQFQKRLGEIHDHDVAIHTIARARGLPFATRTRILKLLEKKREELIGKFFVLRARHDAERPSTFIRKVTQPTSTRSSSRGSSQLSAGPQPSAARAATMPKAASRSERSQGS
jgi:CHAD domain-containing protein